MDPIIVTKGLSRRFDNQIAVDSLDLCVERGTVFGFLGPNGAGKTTTVRLLNGLLKPSDGQATVLGLDLATDADTIRRQTGVLTETPSLYEALTARQNLRFFGDLYGVDEGQLSKRVDAVLHEFGLADRADDRVGSYSKGMRQRLALCRALLHEPELVFLDEPTAALDPAAARMVTKVIQQLSQQQGRTVFLCTHNLGEAQRLCDQVGLINQGRLQAVGTPQELARDIWKGLWVEIDLNGSPSPLVVQAVQALNCVHEQESDEGAFRIHVDDVKNIPDVVAAIVRAGGQIYSVTPLEHSLEEIYFEIQGNQRAQGGLK